MGGDNGLATTLPACVDVLKRDASVRVTLVGVENKVRAALEAIPAAKAFEGAGRILIAGATEIVSMGDSPSFALRKKKDSSMRVAINLVQSGDCDACVSAGNTGALMATAKFVLKTIPGIERPAICSSLPKLQGHTYMLDLGANINAPAEILFQFGLMGSVLMQCLEEKSDPKIGLLNIGEEEVKGNDTIKAAAELFKESHLNYCGFCGGR